MRKNAALAAAVAAALAAPLAEARVTRGVPGAPATLPTPAVLPACESQ